MLTIPLLGRDAELDAVDTLLDGARTAGGALVIRGDAGIGKSALLVEAARRATANGQRVLRTTGVESEARLPFAGLHQLIQPVLDHAEDLPGPQRAAVLGAFGMAETDVPNPFLIGLGVLELLGEAAADTPLVLIAEDAHWLDRASAHVLGFVARRLGSEPIALLAGVRDGADSALDGADLPDLRLPPLDDGAAATLLDAQPTPLAPTVRARLLAAAAGNPLALVELPLAWEGAEADAALPTWLPLTTRLEQAFASRASGLPARTRLLLLVAATNDGDGLGEALAAATLLARERVDEADLAPAVTAQLLEAGDGGLRFRHPLVRSAIHQAAPLARRHAAHAALAQVVEGDRCVWHRAAAAVDPDEDLAVGLEGVGERARRRGATAVAVSALERAARVSEDAAHRGNRLLRASELAFELGRYDVVERLLDQAQPLELGTTERGRLAWLRQLFGNTHWTGAADVAPFLAIVDGMADEGDVEAALSSLMTVAFRLWWSNPDEEMCERVVAAADRMPVDPGRPELLAIRALAAPVGQGEYVLARLESVAPEAIADPGIQLQLADAASGCGDFPVSMRFSTAAIEGLRGQGRVGLLAQGLVSHAWAALHLGAWSVAVPAAQEADRLSRETGQPRYAAAGTLADAAIAALRGEEERAGRIADEAEAVLLPMGVSPLIALCHYARGLGALSAGRHADAYTDLCRIFDPSAVGYHRYVRIWALGDLADAAVHCDRHEEARSALRSLDAYEALTPSPLLHVGLAWARALLAPDDSAEERFAAALAHGELRHRPFMRGRVELAFGAWLRRQRRVAESRGPLRSARETFDALGATPWSERARQELRAAGETSRRRVPEAWADLSPQELQIAQMAAGGLTNREIGQQLYLSHRTVSTHLYRIFPKLGISSRAELLRALPEPTVI